MITKCEIKKCLFNSSDKVIEEIIEEIIDAKDSIYVMHFWFSWKPIADSLIKAYRNGVKINILTDQRTLVKLMEDRQRIYKLSVLEYLYDNKIKQIRVFFKKLLHHKVIIIDNTLVVGSLNLFKKSIENHVENVMLINSKEACEYYKKEFNSLSKDALELRDACERTKFHVRS